jgi:myosin-7
LRGYHQCTKEEAALLGALVYRVKFGETKQDIGAVLKEILPADMIKIQSSQVIKSNI